MDKGYSVAVKKLGTIGVTVEIMRPGVVLPHEVTVYSDEDLAIMAAQNGIETEATQDGE